MKTRAIIFSMITLLAVSSFYSCKPPKKRLAKSAVSIKEKRYHVVKEAAFSPWNDSDNLDSPAYYQSEDGKTNWVVVSSKANHNLWVFDAVNGNFIKTFGKKGKNIGEFKRPNGVWILDDLLLVSEVENHRIQAFRLPDFKSLGIIGESDLINPYGLTFFKDSVNKYQLYVTDNFHGENDAPYPVPEKLNNRICHFTFSVQNETINWQLIKKFGDTKGRGMLLIVESIYADPANNNLLICDEDKNNLGVKVYDLKGNFKGVVIANVNSNNIFRYQAEGIALYDCGNGEGFWIVTDQDYYLSNNNTFHIFDRKTFDYIDSFISAKTDNTDGVWLSQSPYGNFPHGAFFAVNNDGGIGIFDWLEIENTLGLNCK